MAPDSPVRMTPPPSVTSASRYTSSTTASSSSRSSIPTYRSRAKVHHVQSTSLPPSTSPTGIDVTNNVDDPTDVSSIDVPDNPSDKEVFHKYCAFIYKLQSTPTAPQCIVCGDYHSFDKCTILADNHFLRDHYIRFCQSLRREQTARATSFPGKAVLPPRRPAQIPTPTNYISSSSPLHESSSTDEEDFRNGHA